MRHAVAREEAAQPRDLVGLRRADEDGSAGAGLEEEHASQDHRAHQLLAERGFGDEQRMQALRIDLECFGVANRGAVREGRFPRELRNLAAEGARAVFDDLELLAVRVASRHAELARKHHVDPAADLARFEGALAVAEPARGAEPAHARDLLGRQDRKDLRAPLRDDRRVVLRHAASICLPAGGVFKGQPKRPVM